MVVRLAGLHKFCWSNMESHSPRRTLDYYTNGASILSIPHQFQQPRNEFAT